MKNKKTVSIIVILLVAILSIAMVILYNNEKQVPKPVSNETNQKRIEIFESNRPVSFNGIKMKTYQSIYGYEITYPVNWAYAENRKKSSFVDANNNTVIVLNSYVINPPSIEDNLSLIYITVQKGRTLKQIRSNFKNKKYGEKIINEITINGINGIKIEDKYLDDSYVVYFENNGKVYSIELVNQTPYDMYGDERDWILSTFRFTN